MLIDWVDFHIFSEHRYGYIRMPKLWAWDGTAHVSSPWIPQQEVNEFMGMVVRWKQLVVHIFHNIKQYMKTDNTSVDPDDGI